MNPPTVEENHTQPPTRGTTATPPTVVPAAAVVPAAGSSVPQLPAPWSTGLCDCFDNVGNCLLTCFCPCITFGRVAEIVDRGETACGVSCALYAMICCLVGCQWVYSCSYRAKMRGLFSLEESPCHDCLVHLCCGACALCQEYRELKNRGFDVELGVGFKCNGLSYVGWKGSLGRQSATIPPSLERGMDRESS